MGGKPGKEKSKKDKGKDKTKEKDKEKNEKSSLVEEPEYGEPFKYDPTFKGPIKNRSCTDILCCLLFIIFFLGMIFCGVWGYLFGDPTKLLYPTDTAGNLCGYADKADKPNLFFFDLIDCAKTGASNIGTLITVGCPTEQVCVKSCPSGYWVWFPSYVAEEAQRAVNPSYKNTTERDKMICKYTVNAATDSRVCVRSCPNITFSWAQALKNQDLQSKMICKYGIDPRTSSKSIQELVTSGDCAAYYVDSTPIVGRCIPSIFTTILNKTAALVTNDNNTIVDQFNNTVTGTALEGATYYLALFLNAKEYGMKILQDVRASWWLMLVFLGISMVVSFLWIIIMRWIAGPMVWITIIVFLGLFGFATYWCISKYLTMKDNPANQGNLVFTTNLSYYTNLAVTWLVLGCIAGGFAAIILLILIFLRTRIMIAIALIKEASRAVGSMVFTLFWPIIPFLLQIILFAFWGATAVYLASVGRGQYQESAFNYTEEVGNDSLSQAVSTLKTYIGSIPCNAGDNSTAGSICAFVKYGGDEYTIYLQFYMLFMLFWVMNFIVALGQMTLAGAFASYYWAFTKPNDIPAFPLSAALWRALRYHLGSIAFGSLIIAIIQMIRVILEYLDHKMKGSENPVAKFFLKCLKCCFWCLEKFMKFLNKNAYILIAVYGKNFCTSAKNAFMLIMRNVVRVAVVDKVTDFLLFIGKLVVVGAVGTLSFFVFSGDIPNAVLKDYISAYVPTLNYYLIPVIIIAIGAYIIAACFFSVYSMGVDTLFLCFLEDLERHDGTPEKPYYMNKELMNILGKKNKKPKNKKE